MWPLSSLAVHNPLTGVCLWNMDFTILSRNRLLAPASPAAQVLLWLTHQDICWLFLGLLLPSPFTDHRNTRLREPIGPSITSSSGCQHSTHTLPGTCWAAHPSFMQPLVAGIPAHIGLLWQLLLPPISCNSIPWGHLEQGVSVFNTCRCFPNYVAALSSQLESLLLQS